MNATLRGRLTRCTLVSIALAVLAMSCSAPRYEYVRNTSLRTAFKMPREWQLFDRETLLGLPPGPQPYTPDPIRGSSASTAIREPSVDHVLDPVTLNTDHPQGVAIVQSFSFDDRDTSSYSALRNYLFPVDALMQDPNSAQVLSYDDSIDIDGVRGVHIVFQFRASSLATAQASVATDRGRGGRPAADAARRRACRAPQPRLRHGGSDGATWTRRPSQVYIMAVLCSASCYQRNGSDISSIVDSWTVLP